MKYESNDQKGKGDRKCMVPGAGVGTATLSELL